MFVIKTGGEEIAGSKHKHLCLDVKRDEAICDQIMDGLKPLLSNKVLSIVVETKVSRLVPKPKMEPDEKRK